MMRSVVYVVEYHILNRGMRIVAVDEIRSVGQGYASVWSIKY
jgi:hypothetical protein